MRHLLLMLGPVDRALRRAADADPEDHDLGIATGAEAALAPDSAGPSPLGASDKEAAAEARLRSRAESAGLSLPIDLLAEEAGLGETERFALLLAAAPEIDAAYGRAFARALGETGRHPATVGLAIRLMPSGPLTRLSRIAALGPTGRLRRRGWLAPAELGPALGQLLTLGPGVLAFLTSSGGDTRLFRDRAEIAMPASIPLPRALPNAAAERLGRRLAAGEIGMVGLWGAGRSGTGEAALAVARATGRPARRLLAPEGLQADDCPYAAVRREVVAAAALDAVLVADGDVLGEERAAGVARALAEELRATALALIVTGASPWRPAAAIAERGLAEVLLPPPDLAERREMLGEALPFLDGRACADLAARHRFGQDELAAIARLATDPDWQDESPNAGFRPPVEFAVGAMVERHGHAFASVIKPRRGPDDLVLPPELHRRVIEIGRFHRCWPRVAEEWGFDRLAPGGGVRALFTGDSGTGKTLAAEVIAAVVGVSLVRVDLGRVVSKWIGETERNLARLFDDAERSQAVLFFDEADALFGRRGNVERGTDRYANLEVSFLLQRLEAFDGLAILASNLKENIDPAFIRRFDVTLHFPRPRAAERGRLWRIALPAAAPVAPALDIAALARLDMTGGGIVGAARTAALIAADAGLAEIGPPEIVQGIARQYHQEARLLSPGELGPYAALAAAAA
jgi:hypothetical protein